MVDVELVWASALFVGEGCFFSKLGGSGTNRHMYLKIAMYDQRAVERFAAAVQPYVSPRLQGDKRPPRLEAHRRTASYKGEEKVYYVAQLGGAPAIGVCEALYQHLWNTDKGDQLARHYALAGRELKKVETRAPED